MIKFEEVLSYLSNKKWNLVDDWKQKIEQVISKSLTEEEERQIKNYSKRFTQPLYFKHDLKTYKTGRIYAHYVLLPNKEIAGLNFKELIIPEKEYIFVSFDYSASQIRHLAAYKNIQKIINIFESGGDVYEEFAKDCQITRDQAKTIFLLLLYGGDEKTIKKQFETLSVDKIYDIVKKHEKWFETKENDYKEKAELARIIQKIEVDFIKEKLIHIYEKQNNTHRLHAVIHDEIVLEIHKKHTYLIPKIKKYLEKNTLVKMEVKVTESETFRFK